MTDSTAFLLREIAELQRENKALRQRASRLQRRADQWHQRWRQDFNARTVSLVCGRCAAVVSGRPTRRTA